MRNACGIILLLRVFLFIFFPGFAHCERVTWESVRTICMWEYLSSWEM